VSTVSSPPRATLVASRLGRAGGLLVTRLADERTLDELRAEAFASCASAQRSEVPEPSGDGEQRGQPERRIATSVGGPVLAEFFTSGATLAMLYSLTGVRWTPFGNQGTFSFYGPGDHLGIHRDAPGCDLALITCVYDDGAPDAPGGELVVYPGRSSQTIAPIRADPGCGAHTVRVAPGETAILLGGIVPHRVTEIGRGRLRVVAPLCYSVLAD